MDIDDLCVNENKSIKEAMKIVDHAGLGIAFIVDNNKKFVGVVTDGNIRRAILKGISLEKRVREITNTSPVVAKKDWNEKEIIDLLKKDNVIYKIPDYGTIRLPVIDENKHVIDMLFASLERCVSYLKSKKRIEEVKPVKKVLVVGGTGFLGSVLCRKLIEKGYFVKVLDNLTYSDHGIVDLYNNPKFEFLQGDMRNIQTVVDAVKDVDALIHLAAIVGDPASALDPEETIEVNYFGTKLLAEICKYSQINRFIFASTCSVYGASSNPDIHIDEKSQLNPVSLYAEMKLKSEQGILELIDENFSPIILRMATIYGLSPRMRFDLVVNLLTAKATIDKKITIFGGEQWRPLLHVKDAAEAYIKCLEAPINKIRGEIFNVGANNENYKISEVGNIIKKIIPETEMVIDQKKIDQRNYNVSFDKIKYVLDYNTKYTIKDGIKEIKEALEKGQIDDYKSEKYSNYKFLKGNFAPE